MAMSLARVAGYKAPSKAVVNIVLDVLEGKPGLSTKEIFNRARAAHPSQSAGSSSTALKLDDGPIVPSISYLKRVILPSLSTTGYVQKFHTSRVLGPEDKEEYLKKLKRAKRSAKLSKVPDVVHEWLWRVVPSPKKSSPQLQKARADTVQSQS